jgi:hypothetical protein
MTIPNRDEKGRFVKQVVETESDKQIKPLATIPAFEIYRSHLLIVAILSFTFFAGALLNPFVEGTKPSPTPPPFPAPSPTPTPQPIIVQSGIDWIVSQSPNNPQQRQTLATVYRDTANKLQRGEITFSNAMTALWNQTQNILQSEAWEATDERLTAFVADSSSDADLTRKLYEIADAFERAR